MKGNKLRVSWSMLILISTDTYTESVRVSCFSCSGNSKKKYFWLWMPFYMRRDSKVSLAKWEIWLLRRFPEFFGYSTCFWWKTLPLTRTVRKVGMWCDFVVRRHFRKVLIQGESLKSGRSSNIFPSRELQSILIYCWKWLGNSVFKKIHTWINTAIDTVNNTISFFVLGPHAYAKRINVDCIPVSPS